MSNLQCPPSKRHSMMPYSLLQWLCRIVSYLSGLSLLHLSEDNKILGTHYYMKFNPVKRQMKVM